MDMIRKICTVLSIVLLAACDSEQAPDCLQTAGDIVEQEISTPFFDKIVVHEHVGLVLKEGPEQQVVVETGEHLLADVSVEVVEDRLVLRNNNTCNFFRFCVTCCLGKN